MSPGYACKYWVKEEEMGKNEPPVLSKLKLTHFFSFIPLLQDLLKVNDDMKDKIIDIENRIIL